MQVINNPTWASWALSPPRDRSFGREQQSSSASSSFHVRINDHGAHQFSPPASPPWQQSVESSRAAAKPAGATESEEAFEAASRGPRRRAPVATFTIFAATVVLFILVMYSNDCLGSAGAASCVGGSWLKSLSFQPWRENPMLGPRRERLLRWGALERRSVVDGHQGWRLLSAGMLNGGLLQLLANLVIILVLGLRLEFVFGWAKVAALYVVSGFGGSVLSALFVSDQVFAGASGAVMGLIGATVADTTGNWNVTRIKPLKLLSALLLAVVSVAFGLMPQADNFANVGGFLAGFLLGLVLLLRPQRGFQDTRHLSPREAYIVKHFTMTEGPPVEEMYRKSQRVVQASAGALLVALLVAGTVVLFVAGDVTRGRCRWYRYMACVPNLKWTCPGPYN